MLSLELLKDSHSVPIKKLLELKKSEEAHEEG